VIGALTIAAVSTCGDFVWAEGHVRDRALFGLTHGTLLFLCMGAYLGALERQPFLGAIAGALIGLLAAGSFYVLAPYAGYSVMFLIWALVWVALAILTGRILPKQSRLTWGAVITRAVLAAIGSAIAFYLISGIWRPFDPQGWDYVVHYVSWTFAYLPGFLALVLKISPEAVQDPVVGTNDEPA
jgi:hypothetical protein